MTQTEKARAFLAVHTSGDPVVLYNIWDAGGAKKLAETGAKAIATSSWSVAASYGYEDGQNMPLDLVLAITARIVGSTDLPVTVDFEGGYAADPDGVKRNVSRLLQTGAIGLNFEDQIVGGEGIYDATTQAARIAAVRLAAVDADVSLVINARTDLFLKQGDATKHCDLVDDAIHRAAIYKEAGADCFFVPGLSDEALIAQICAAVALPVNVMVLDTTVNLDSIIKTRIARISFGPAPYFTAMTSLGEAANKQL